MQLPCIAPPCLAALALASLLAAPAPAQVWVNAGQDTMLPAGHSMMRLAGSAGGFSPLDFWVADGDGLTENRLLKWNDVTGLTVVGPLQTAAGRVYGWPSDFERVRGTVYGIETFDKKLYTLDGNTAICTDVGPALSSYTRLFGLAYDFGNDHLYAVDNKTRKIIKIDRTTAVSSVVMTLPSNFSDVRGLAYRVGDGKLYFCDDATETLQRINLATLAIEHVMDFNDGPNAKVDEIEFYEGQLFCCYRSYDSLTDIWSAQLARLDVEDEIAIPYGPLITDVSAHSLVIFSVPEHARWVQVSGPATAQILQQNQLDSPVTFPAPGQYVFELRAELFRNVVTADQVTIRVQPKRPPNSAGGPGGNGPAPVH